MLGTQPPEAECECAKKAAKGREKELLLVDRQFQGEDSPGIFSENMVVAGVDGHRLQENTILKICPTLRSKQIVLPLPSQKEDHAKAFSDALLNLKRQCVHVQLHGKRDCAGTAEEKRGERGVFASTLDADGGIICVGDSITPITQAQLLNEKLARW